MVKVFCLTPGPFAQAIWTFSTQGGDGQDCASYPAGWYSGVCSPSGDHVDRIIANGLILPTEVGDAGLADGGYFVEFDRAITNYGGLTSYTRDVSILGPLLGGGETTFRLYVQNGCTDGGYMVNASLHLLPGKAPALTFSQTAPGISFVRVSDQPDGGGGSQSAQVNLAQPLPGAQLLVFATGHNDQGLSCEEFCPGDQVAFTFDGADAGVLTPELGKGNPACVAGCDGCGSECSASSCTGTSFCSAASGCCEASSVNREGWCPGLPAPLYLLPLGDLAAGPHRLLFASPGAVTPGGYWELSANLVGQ